MGFEAKISKLRDEGIPKATKKQTVWCVNLWSQWAVHRRNSLIEEAEKKNASSVNITEMSKAAIKFWLMRFVVEVRQKDGNPYTPNTLYQICCGLERAIIRAGRTDVEMSICLKGS